MKKKVNSENKLLDTLLIGLLIIPYLLVKIGDLVKFILQKFFSLIFELFCSFGKPLYFILQFLKRLFNLLFRLLNKGLDHLLDFKDKFILSVAKVLNTLPPPKLPSLSHWGIPRFHFPHLRFSLPKNKTLFRRPQGEKNLGQWEKSKYFVFGAVATIIILFIPYNIYVWLSSLPEPITLTARDISVTTKIFDRHGSLLYEIYAEQNRTPLSLAEIPDMVEKATIAIEDKDFYSHKGISFKGVFRAFFQNVSRGTNLQGGSTITQQLVRSALLSSEKTWERKIKEAVLAFWTEHLYTKDQILEMYLNQVPYGGTAWGIEAAAETYFGKKVKNLSLAEGALLAGLPAAPTLYSPFGAHPQYAVARQKEVLKRMREDGYISREEEMEALKQKLNFTSPKTSLEAPHFVMYVKDLLIQKYGIRLVEQGGLRVTTTLDLPLQRKVQEIVGAEVSKLKNLRVGNGASLVTNPKTGEILAMVGSKNYFDLSAQGNVNVVFSSRQPGSSIKVINYAAALDRGIVTPATILDDSPVSYWQPGQPPYQPVNYDGKFHGKVPLRLALANSYNIPAVKILNLLGVDSMIDTGEKMGITTWQERNRFGLSLTLGGGEITMHDLTEVYGALANEGNRVDLHPFLKITNYKNELMEELSPNSFPAISDASAFIISNFLSDNLARSNAFGINSALNIPGKTVSVKTGTTNDKRDNWTLGYTPSFVVAVWVGNNDNSPMDPVLTSGITGAAPIWNQIMTYLIKDKPDEPPAIPQSVKALPCYGRTEYFIRGTEPKGGCAPLPTPTPSPTPGG